MHKSGLGLLLIGVALAAYAMLQDVSVAVPTTPGLGIPPQRTINLGLQQRQMMIFLAGIAAQLAGVVLIGLARLEEVLLSRLRPAPRHPDDRPTPPSADSPPRGTRAYNPPAW